MQSRILNDWEQQSARPNKGHPIRPLAQSYEAAANAVPPEVALIMTEAFGPTELLFAAPEHRTMFSGGMRESQSDVLAIVRHPGGLATYTIEGQIDEPLGLTVGEWISKASPGKITRLAQLCALLGLTTCPSDIRYDLVHRMASALLEAERFGTELAGMIVHSFSRDERWYNEFARFGALLGCTIELGRSATIKVPSGQSLAIGWAVAVHAHRLDDHAAGRAISVRS